MLSCSNMNNNQHNMSAQFLLGLTPAATLSMRSLSDLSNVATSATADAVDAVDAAQSAAAILSSSNSKHGLMAQSAIPSKGLLSATADAVDAQSAATVPRTGLSSAPVGAVDATLRIADAVDATADAVDASETLDALDALDAVFVGAARQLGSAATAAEAAAQAPTATAAAAAAVAAAVAAQAVAEAAAVAAAQAAAQAAVKELGFGLRSRELALHHADFHARATAAATLGAEEGFRSAARDFIAGLAAVITSQAEQREAGQQQQQHWSNSGQCVTTYPGSKPGAAVQVAPGQLKRQQHERSFLKQLRELLQGLPPAQRRDFIAQRLSQAQRVSLEQWILAERAGPMQGAIKQGRPFKTGIHCPGLSQRSLCCWRGKRGRVGYRPIMHLFGSFYAQAAFTFDLSSAVAALGTLLTMRTLCQALGGTCTQKQGGDQEVVATLRAAVHDALAMKRPGPIGHRFYFKTRMRMAHGYEISTPSRSDVDTALGEWLHLLRTKAGGARAPKATDSPVTDSDSTEVCETARDWSASNSRDDFLLDK
ncbi:unnamed protein product, partial [Polarella glacialis]